MFIGDTEIRAAYIGNEGLVKMYLGDEELEVCAKDVDEFLDNAQFTCGIAYWGHAPIYPAEISDNGDGTVHLKTLSEWGSLVPGNDSFPNGSWIIEVEILNQVGNGKISFRKPNGQWVSTPTIGDGVHTATYTGEIREIHVGADSDPNYEADYNYISLKHP